MPPRKQNPERRWSMYRQLHDDVSRLLEEEGLYFTFNKKDTDEGCHRSYDTNITGRFICRNKKCGSPGWSSKMVAITIRMYPGARYNARVYHQSCKSCNCLSRPLLNDTYAERIAYRIKKWNGIEVETPHYSGNSELPHNEDLCEGCKAGHCKRLNNGFIGYYWAVSLLDCTWLEIQLIAIRLGPVFLKEVNIPYYHLILLTIHVLVPGSATSSDWQSFKKQKRTSQLSQHAPSPATLSSGAPVT